MLRTAGVMQRKFWLGFLMTITLDTVESEFGTITVSRKRSTSTITYEQGGCCQSEADGNGVSLASYVHAIFGLILQTGAHKILMIGCAGGTLATMLAQAGREVTIIDVNPASFILAKQYFGLPDSVECRTADGKLFLYSDTTTYDAVVLDAFHGDRIPAHLKSLNFYYLVSDRLSLHGAVFANVHVQHDLDHHADRIASCLSKAFPDVRLLDSEGYRGRNAIVMAGSVSHLHTPNLITPPTADRELIESELATMKFRAWRASR
jgi:spermidine synthase